MLSGEAIISIRSFKIQAVNHSLKGNMSVDEYYNSLSDLEKSICEMARFKLDSSFNLAKCNGYKKWKAEREKAQTVQETPEPTPVALPAPELEPAPEPAPAEQAKPDAPVKKKVTVKKKKVSPKNKRVVKKKTVVQTLPLRICESVQSANQHSQADMSDLNKLFLDELDEAAGVYIIASNDKCYSIGTTTDFKKNVRLACKSVLKTMTEDDGAEYAAFEELVGKTKAKAKSKSNKTDVEGTDAPKLSLYCILIREEVNKQRLAMRKVLRSEYLPE